MLLIVDDNEMNRDLLSRRLERLGYSMESAQDGVSAMEMIQADPQRYDLILLDVMMPNMNGYEVLECIKASEALRHIPVIMISALDEIGSVVRCIKLGAEDYLPKPFNPTLLQARIGATLEKKRLHDQEQAYLARIQEEQERSERLLLNVLPKPIADRLKDRKETIVDSFAEVTVLFADIVDFTSLTTAVPPEELINLLNRIFTLFDQLAEKHGLEKIKTIGDSYMVAGGLPIPRDDHAQAVAEMALDMMDAIGQFHAPGREGFSARIGINTGPVIAGVIGTKKFIYDLWGDTVNLANRMESQGLPGRIQVTPAVYQQLRQGFAFEKRSSLNVKGKGQMDTYLLNGRAGSSKN